MQQFVYMFDMFCLVCRSASVLGEFRVTNFVALLPFHPSMRCCHG